MKAFPILVAVLVAVIVFQLVVDFKSSSLQDDAYMFVRYADCIIQTGVASFNSGGEATYGLTSPAFLTIALPLRAIFTENPVLTMLCSSSISGLFFIMMLVLLIRKINDGNSAPIKNIVIFVVLLSFVYDVKDFSIHFMSGMDTMQTLAFLTGFILLIIWHQKSLSVFSTLITGLLGGLAFSFRPDLLIFTLIVPFVLLISSSNSKTRIMAAVMLLMTALVVLLQVLFYSEYLNSPLPLPFYAKSIDNYGAHFQEIYTLFPLKQFARFIFSFPFLFSAMGIAFFIDIKGLWRWFSGTGKGLLIATAVFMGYHLFFVTPIMDYSQRFYYPALPAIVFLSIQCMKFIYKRTSLQEIIESGSLGRINSRAIMALFLLFLVFAFGTPVTEEAYKQLVCDKDGYTGFDITEEYRARWTGYWFCLDKFSELPADLVIAATEVGHPLAMNPEKMIIDMTGLNETEIAHFGFSSDTFFHSYQPDLIFMPHPDYQDMIQSINENQYFKSNYEVYSGLYLSTTLALAVKTDSKYYQQMRQIVSDHCKSIWFGEASECIF
ncbi:MAG: hypothetical protein KAR40_08865 [Candidatus Sabulitectum sp.]|nr:hypothetical protein [Candidatus Sabulitectum sp.]